MTKSVQFDENGRRSEIDIQISSLTTQGPIQIATWNTELGVKSIPVAGITTTGSDVLRNRTFIVLISMVCNGRFENCKSNMNFIQTFLFNC